MGVRGLMVFVKGHNNSCLKNYKLKNSIVFIDGSNLVYFLHSKTPKTGSAFGGDYDKYAAYIKFFFTR